ncbi:Zinc finger and BTB domain-containing protein 5 [Aix galericulata]|nr:Zinc finger and BTB domain-containing protein 5 [Aix galericulata]
MRQNSEEQPNAMSSTMRSNMEQRTTFPIRRLHKRKQSSEDRARQRMRPAIDESVSDVTPESGQLVVHSREDFFSADSLKIVDNSKADAITDNQEDSAIMFDQPFSAQEDTQVPSQSDNSGGNIPQMSMASQATQVETSFDQEAASEKNNFPCDNPEVTLNEKEHMRVVVKSEPLSSPEPQDEVSDVTSQAEGSESVEVEGGVVSAEKIELSPESSDRSFSDPQSSTDRLGYNSLTVDVIGTVAAEKRHQTHLSGFSRLEGDAASCTLLQKPALAPAQGCKYSLLHLLYGLRQPAARSQKQSHGELCGGISQDIRGVSNADPSERKAQGSGLQEQQCYLQIAGTAAEETPSQGQTSLWTPHPFTADPSDRALPWYRGSVLHKPPPAPTPAKKRPRGRSTMQIATLGGG